MEKTENSENVEQLVRDLEYVKAAVKRNYPILREMMSPRSLRGYVMYVGTVVIVISLLFQFVIRAYGSLSTAPQVVRTLLLVFIAFIALSVTFMKWTTLNRSARRIDRRLSPWSVVREYYMAQVIHVDLPLLLAGGCVIVYLALSGHGFYITGALAVTFGLVMNVLGAYTRLREYLFFGYWVLLTGALSMLVPAVSAGVWVSAVFGGGCYVFALASVIQGRRDSRDRSKRG